MDHLFTEWLPSPQSGGTTNKPRLLTNHFNGDVTFDRPDGINTDLHTYQATWILHQDAADDLLHFLRMHTCKAFLWNMPRDAVDRIWEATEWTRGSDGEDRDIIQVTFEERFMATTPPPPLPPPAVLSFRLSSSPLGGGIHLG